MTDEDEVILDATAKAVASVREGFADFRSMAEDALESGSATEIEGALRSFLKVLVDVEAEVTRMVALAAVYATRGSADEGDS